MRWMMAHRIPTPPTPTRWLPVMALLAAVFLLAACASPSSFPQGNNATCWTKLREHTTDTPTCEETTEKWTDWGDVWTWGQCSSGGMTVFEFAYNPADCQHLPTTKLNTGHG